MTGNVLAQILLTLHILILVNWEHPQPTDWLSILESSQPYVKFEAVIRKYRTILFQGIAPKYFIIL